MNWNFDIFNLNPSSYFKEFLSSTSTTILERKVKNTEKNPPTHPLYKNDSYDKIEKL